MENLSFKREILAHPTLCIKQRYLLEEDSVLSDGQINGKETRGEGGAECVAVHEGNLGADRLVLQKVLFWRDHVSKDLTMRLHDCCHCLICDLG